MSKTAIFFGPLKGAVNRVADKLKDAIGDDKVEMIPVNTATVADIKKYDRAIHQVLKSASSLSILGEYVRGELNIHNQ